MTLSPEFYLQIALGPYEINRFVNQHSCRCVLKAPEWEGDLCPSYTLQRFLGGVPGILAVDQSGPEEAVRGSVRGGFPPHLFCPQQVWGAMA